MKNEVRLSIGISGESVYLLRTVVASFAARLDFSLDDIEDLTLAVSEAAAFLLLEKSEASRLTMRVAASSEGVEAVLSTDAAAAVWPPPNLENGLAWKVLSTLADLAEFVRETDGSGIRLVKRGPAPGGSR